MRILPFTCRIKLHKTTIHECLPPNVSEPLVIRYNDSQCDYLIFGNLRNVEYMKKYSQIQPEWKAQSCQESPKVNITNFFHSLKRHIMKDHRHIVNVLRNILPSYHGYSAANFLMNMWTLRYFVQYIVSSKR